MSQSVLIGGGTGFLGKHLRKLLESNGYNVTVVSRMPGPCQLTWDNIKSNGIPQGTSAVVNLAGQNVMDLRRWTVGFKQNVYTSRVNTTLALAKAINNATNKPSVFVTISGVGIYEPSSTKEYHEESPVKAHDFLSSLSIDWEAAAQLPPETDCRVVTLRSGVILGKDGGMIKSMYIPYWLGLGGPLGSGNQYLPWIHIDDITNLILFAIENDRVTGVFNGVAPDQITNKQFSDAFAKALWRPAFIPVPETALNVLLNKERAIMLTKGQRVVPRKALNQGFRFKYGTILSACKEVVG